MNYNNLIVSIIFVIIITLILKMFTNKSGVPTHFILPAGIAGITLYLIGGWDLKKPDWCPIDIITWFSFFSLAFIICISPFPKSTQTPQNYHQNNLKMTNHSSQDSQIPVWKPGSL